MKKRTYIMPQTLTVTVAPVQMVCTSQQGMIYETAGGNLEVNLDGTEDFGNGATINARRSNIWDWNEE